MNKIISTCCLGKRNYTIALSEPNVDAIKIFMFDFTQILFNDYLTKFKSDISKCKNQHTFYFILYCKLILSNSRKQLDSKKFYENLNFILQKNIDFFNEHLRYYYGDKLNGVQNLLIRNYLLMTINKKPWINISG